MQPVWCHLYLSTMLFLALMIPEFVQIFLGGRIKSMSEDPAAHRALDSEL